MIRAISFHVQNIVGDPPKKILTGFDGFVASTGMINVPLGVCIQMSSVGDVLVAVLKNGHLFDGVSPGVEGYLTTLGVEGKVRNSDRTFGVDPDLGHPSDHASVGYPRVE